MLFFLIKHVYLQSKYVEKVSEAIPPYSYILTVEASDADDGKNALQLYSLSGTGANDFVIDSAAGKSIWHKDKSIYNQCV